MKKPVLVIGGGGFIGRHLTAQLIASGEAVRVFDIIPCPQNMPAPIDWQQGSILDDAALDKAISGAKTVFHLAALAHLGVPQAGRYAQINTRGTQNVIKVAAKNNIDHLLITSTEVILRDWRSKLTAPLTVEGDLPDMGGMAGPYCRSKLAAEHAARNAMNEGQPISLLYPTVPIGAGDYNLTAPTAMIRQFLKAPPPAFLDCRLNLVPVEDVARAHILAAANPAGGKYMLGGEDIDMADLLGWLSELTDKTMPKNSIPYALAAMTAHISSVGSKMSGKAPLASVEGVRLARHKINIDSSPTTKILGWRQGSAREAVGRAAEWLAREGHLN